MFIRPVLIPDGEHGARFKIRDPDTMLFLADAGEEKPESDYWQRRLLLDHSVELCDPPPSEPQSAKETA